MNSELVQILMKQNAKQVLSDLKELVSIERKTTGQILHYFLVVQKRRLFAEYGYPDIYKFGIRELGYTEAETQRRVMSSRLLGEVPDLEEKLDSGALSLTAVSMAQTLFNREHKAQNTFSLQKKLAVLESFENKTVKECEREVLRFATVPVPPREQVKPVSPDGQSLLTIVVSSEFLEKIEKLKSLCSHSDPGISTADLLNKLVGEAVQKKDLAREPRRKNTTEIRRDVSVSKQPDKARPIISAAIKREIWKRDQSQCTFRTPNGKRCEGRYNLEIDHVQPVALGGETDINNLRLLCKAHNQLGAIKTFGFQKMNRFINLDKSIGMSRNSV